MALFLSDPSEVSLSMPCELSWDSPDTEDELWVFWSRHNDELRSIHPHILAVEASSQIVAIKEKIKCFLRHENKWGASFLIQVWVTVVIGDRTYLTIANQPFGLNVFHEGLCSYRKHCLKYILPVDNDDWVMMGPPVRVVHRGLPEYCFNVGQNYLLEEYPHRDIAVRFGVKSYYALPLLLPPLEHCLGVLEIVWDELYLNIEVYYFLKQEELNLISFHKNYSFEMNFSKDAEKVLREIDGVSRRVSKKIITVHSCSTWFPNSDSSCLTFAKKQYGVPDYYAKKGEGVVGRAFASQSACFCKDIKLLSINEYPLVPDAREFKFSACFAICLQSSYTGNFIWVLEILLSFDETSSEDPKTLLSKLFVVMKQKFKSLRVASSGQDKLFVEVIKVSPDDHIVSFEICDPDSTGCTTGVAHSLAGRREMIQIDTMPEQIDVMKNATHNICAESIEIAAGVVHPGSLPQQSIEQPGTGNLGEDVPDEIELVSDSRKSTNQGLTKALVPEYQNFTGIAHSHVEGAEISLDDQPEPHKNGKPTSNGSKSGRKSDNKGVTKGTKISLADQLEPLKRGDPASSRSKSRHKSRNKGVTRRVEISPDDLPQSLKNGDPTSSRSKSGRKSGNKGVRKVVEISPDDHPKSVKNGNPTSSIFKSKGKSESTGVTKTSDAAYGITLEILERHFGKKLADVENILGVGRSTIKRRCRDYGIQRWPRKARKHNVSLLPQEIIQQMQANTGSNTLQNAEKVPEDFCITVKATYRDDMIKFPLSISSKLMDLEEEVTKRIKLPVGSFKIRYVDEDGDCVVIACDADLNNCINAFKSLGQSTIKMSVHELQDL